MEKRLEQIHKERGISKRCLYNIAHSKDSPAHKVSKAKCSWWYFDEEKLDRWLVKHAGIAFLLLLLLMPTTKASAGWVGTDNAVGGVGLALENYVKRTGHGLYDEKDLDLLSAAMQLENGCNSDRCLLLTGSVILNRRDKHWADSIEGVLLQGFYDDGYAQQYATHTVVNLYTTEASERVRLLALRLLLYGAIDKDVIYQSQYKNLGKHPFSVDGEWFAY